MIQPQTDPPASIDAPPPAPSDGEHFPPSAADHNPSFLTADEIDRSLGERLRSLRREAGLTQSDVAELLSVSAQQYQKYEKGATRCSLSTIYRLAAHYNIPLTDILPAMPPTATPASHGGFEEEATFIDAANLGEAEIVSKLVSMFAAIPSASTRRKLLDLLNDVA